MAVIPMRPRRVSLECVCVGLSRIDRTLTESDCAIINSRAKLLHAMEVKRGALISQTIPHIYNNRVVHVCFDDGYAWPMSKEV